MQKKQFDGYTAGVQEYFCKHASLFLDPIIGAAIGHSAAKEGKGASGTGIGVMAGLSSAIGSKAGEGVAKMLGFEGGSISKSIGALAGLMAFKSLYEMNPHSGVFEQNKFTKNLMEKFDAAQRAASKSVSMLPYADKMKNLWEEKVEKTVPDAISYIENLFSKLD